jgi:hypothetical protein
MQGYSVEEPIWSPDGHLEQNPHGPYRAEPYGTHLRAQLVPLRESCVLVCRGRFLEARGRGALKTSGLDAADPGSCRPISNLAKMSNLLERPAAARLVRYLETTNLLPPLQSGCRPRHTASTVKPYGGFNRILAVANSPFDVEINVLIRLQ